MERKRRKQTQIEPMFVLSFEKKTPLIKPLPTLPTILGAFSLPLYSQNAKQLRQWDSATIWLQQKTWFGIPCRPELSS